MRICLVNPTRLIRRPISELAKTLHDRGHDVGILTPEGESGLHHEQYLDGIDIHTYTAWEPPIDYEWPIPWGFTSTLQKIEDDYDVFHSWTDFYLSSVLLAWHQPGKHVVTLDTVPGESFQMNGFIDTLFHIYNRSLGRWVLGRANTVTVYSDELIPYLRNTGCDGEVHVTPTGVIPPEVTSDLDLPDDYVAFIGHTTRRKGIDRLLNIAERLNYVDFLVAGDSPSRDEWEARSPDNVEFLGQVDYVPALLDQARCLVLPSRGEGLPGVVMEAMAMRCGVVASNIPCIPELIRDNRDGLLVDQDDIDGFVDAIRDIGDEHRLVDNAYQRITNHFSWDAARDGFTDVYEHVLEEAP